MTRPSDSELQRLVRDNKNEELQLIMKKFAPNELVDRTGKTILHLAAKYGNIELLKSLLHSRRALNAVTSRGMTPLMTAISNNQFKAAKLLLKAKPDVFIRNSSGVTALQMAVRRKVPADVIKKFIDALRKLNFTPDRIIAMLERAGCSLKYALSFNDAWVLRALLQRRESINYRESSILMRKAMNYPSKESVANLITLMNYGPERDARKSIFLKEISYEIECYFPSLNAAYLKDLMKQLMKVNGIDQDFAIYFAKVFGSGKKSAVKLLLECEIHAHIKERFSRDLLTHLFGNRKVNAIKLTRNSKFDVNAKGRGGFSALHFAVMSDLVENVKFLLDNGADPNSKDNFGMTPMFLAANRKCVQLLLEHDADVQIRDTEGLTVLDLRRYPMLDYVLAHLALIEFKGNTVKSYMYDTINATRKLKDFYSKCRAQLEWMKRRNIFQYITLFRVLTDKPENIVQFVPSLEKGTGIMDWYYECSLEKYYFSILKRNLKKAVKMYELKCKAALSVCRFMRLFDPEHLVVRTIVNYLTYEDLLVFA